MLTLKYNGRSEDLENFINIVKGNMLSKGNSKIRIIVDNGDARENVYVLTMSIKSDKEVEIKRYPFKRSENQAFVRNLMSEANKAYSNLPEEERKMIKKNKFVGKYISEKAKEIPKANPIKLNTDAMIKAISNMKNGGVKNAESERVYQ